MTDDVSPGAGAQVPFVARSIQSGNVALDRVVDLMLGLHRPFELRIDSWGVVTTGRSGVAAPWAEIADVYMLQRIRERFFVYELTSEGAQRHGRGVGRWTERGLHMAVRPGVQLPYVDREEWEVLDAVHAASGGRFPSAERTWAGRGRYVPRAEVWPGRSDGPAR